VKYRIVHHTRYRYAAPVPRSVHLAHLRPRALRHQEALGFTLDITPTPVEHHQGTDYFGNPTDGFTIEGPHETLTIKCVSEVKVHPTPVPASSKTSWEEVSEAVLRERSPQGLQVREFLGETSLTPRLPGLDDYARQSFTPGRSFVDAVLDFTARIDRDYQFDSKATTVSTPLEQVVQQKRGVCQDFSHLMIACLRSLRLPARYTSGYLRTIPPPGQARLVGADASHAWVSVFSPETGWFDVDPTNNRLVDQDHITLGWGRDYGEVSLIRGVLDGGGAHKLKFSVDVTEEPE